MTGLKLAIRGGVVAGLLLLTGAAAWAQAKPETTSVGPGRIVCSGGEKCLLDVGTPPTNLRSQVDVSALTGADHDRLVKRCTAKGTACIATVTGTLSGAVIKASAIKFYN